MDLGVGPRLMIAHFTSQLAGGANVAGYRLHVALRRAGYDSKFYYGTGDSADPSVLPLFQNQSFFRRNVAALAVSWRSRQQAPGGFVTSPGWIRKTPIQATGALSRVVNLHWVARWLDLPSFLESLPFGLPVIWTLHDLIPITGGCHYPGGCDGFTRECGNCPQLKRCESNDASHRFFLTKKRWYQRTNLHFVGNSAWTTAQANRSGLLKYAKSVRTIHYGLDTEAYRPIDKRTAREALKISQEKFVVGFACSDFHEERKGAAILLAALNTFPADRMCLVVLGGGRWPQGRTEIETITMGSINTARLQSVFYSALDVFAMPSQIETFGNVAMEAMACKTPVIAYSAGGLADVVANGETGLLEREIGSVPGLIRMLQWMREHPDKRVEMGIAARQRVLENFSDSLMARRYLDLYDELGVAPSRSSPSTRLS